MPLVSTKVNRVVVRARAQTPTPTPIARTYNSERLINNDDVVEVSFTRWASWAGYTSFLQVNRSSHIDVGAHMLFSAVLRDVCPCDREQFLAFWEVLSSVHHIEAQHRARPMKRW